MGIKKTLPTGNLCSLPHFYLSRDEDDFGNGDGDGKAFPDSILSHYHPYVTFYLGLAKQFIIYLFGYNLYNLTPLLFDYLYNRTPFCNLSKRPQ